jgi:hypothetical protein
MRTLKAAVAAIALTLAIFGAANAATDDVKARYMKAIPTAAKPCLACHGAKISPEVAAKLDDIYPEDKARGYGAGDIRGAFTIRQPM